MLSPNAERLRDAVKARRAELDLTQLDVWQFHNGPSNSTLTEIENARLGTLTRTTAAKLDRALQWEKGSARRVWDGKGEPRPLLPGVTSSDDSEYLRQTIGQAHLDAVTKERLLEVLDRKDVG